MGNPLDYSGIAANAAGAFANGVINVLGSDRQMKQQKELMDYQAGINERMWNMQNAYNTPLKQRERLKAAGLNPDLMYGNGSAGVQAPLPAGSSGGSAPAYTPAPSGVDPVSALKTINEAKKAGADTVGQNIVNDYLAQKFQAEIANLVKDLKVKDKNMDVSEATIKHLAQLDAESVQNVDTAKTRLGYEKFDRMLNAISTAMDMKFKQANIDDMVATRASRIFQAMANGRMADANAAMIGLFRDPQKLKKWVTDIKKVIFGDGNKDSGLVGEVAKDLGLTKEESGYVRGLFMWLDKLVNGDVPYDIRNQK